MRYRVDLPVVVLAFKDNHYAAVNIPPGETFDVIAPAEDDRFVVVDGKGHQFLVFDSDLKGGENLWLRGKSRAPLRTGGGPGE